MLGSTGLVLLMVPGLALFYAGMVRRKNVLGTMMHSMVALGLIGLQWVLIGYSLAFGESWRGLIGWSPKLLGLSGVLPSDRFPGTHIPVFVHCMYQGMFAIITPALISGAIAERVRFGPYCLFIVLWATLVYDPLAHWVWAVSEHVVGNDVRSISVGWIGDKLGAIDFAGGTVVHISAGFSALAAILILKKRRGYPQQAIHPNSMVLTLTGAGLLWFGWFGFNGGSALGSNPLAGMALAASQVAAAAAATTWMFAEWLHKGKPTALGFASGLVAGLVAVTPASGYVSPLGALCIGVAAGLVCYFMVCLKPLLGYDDSLDAFGVHGVGGFLGAVLTGLFASFMLWTDANGFNQPLKTADGSKPAQVKGADGKEKEFGPWFEDLGAMKVKEIGEGNDKKQMMHAKDIPVRESRWALLQSQIIAATVSALYSFVMTAILVCVINVTWGFGLTPQAEGAGLDQSEHGEVGFDLSPTMEFGEPSQAEPKHADMPPNGRRHYTVVVEGADPAVLMRAWSDLCQSGPKMPPPELKLVYPLVTTVKGNRFHFRGGDPYEMRHKLQTLFENSLEGTPIRAHVEN